MGCGKSTIAKALSKTANSVCRFDKYIEEKLIFSAIFENMEKYFRKIEHEVLSNY
jgi:shikimate kinase